MHQEEPWWYQLMQHRGSQFILLYELLDDLPNTIHLCSWLACLSHACPMSVLYVAQSTGIQLPEKSFPIPEQCSEFIVLYAFLLPSKHVLCHIRKYGTQIILNHIIILSTPPIYWSPASNFSGQYQQLALGVPIWSTCQPLVTHFSASKYSIAPIYFNFSLTKIQ